ncbi:membrane protein [Acetobacter aceti 1023]|nr:membrane protein [Acetobacter aceti 1023]
MKPSLPSPEIFQHVRIIMGMVIGLSVTRLLNGLVRIIQHPDLNKIYPVHIGWVLTLLLMLVHFWWWELWLVTIPTWNFETYFFLVTYTILLFFLSSFLFPDSISDYSGYEDFFLSRRKWFFSIFALVTVFDLIDTLIKGHAHYALFSYEYWFRIPLYLLLCAIAVITINRKFHLFFVFSGLLYEISWILRHFETLS